MQEMLYCIQICIILNYMQLKVYQRHLRYDAISCCRPYDRARIESVKVNFSHPLSFPPA